MKRTKRVALLTLMLSGAFVAGVYAQDVIQEVRAYLRPDFNLVVDGSPAKLEGSILIFNDKSYLPLTELGQMLGANIYWKAENKTIYVNSRINPEQRKDDSGEVYETIQMYNPYSVKLNYLGTEYPMLITYNNATGSASYEPFYRLSDVRRMGVDTDGLKKTRERYTQELYVSEKELDKRWSKQKPTKVYDTSGSTYVISEEVHPVKLDLLRTHVKNTLNSNFSNVTVNDKPIIIDKVADEEDTYDYLFYETIRSANVSQSVSGFYKARIQLYKNNLPGSNTTYSLTVTNKTDLTEEAKKRENPQ
ncbi:stalk domain-containing protein [Paenibacillus cremeus]|uniref:Copper amine oxidase-like N-terminal domain-containing protein n=1 Tax=Paenibacillus cremeus TaxID=2163881 RepID=A0A559K3N2_9BACL|nr:hypothetical protein [Paenibacillus cremeus]TVY06748.1 hypothetical protein FPZ49_27720 [Paenibacillus cremeus]